MRTIVITGAGEGLGRTLAELYADRGDRVFGCDIELAGLEELRRSHRNVEVKRADVSRPDDVAALFALVRAAGSTVDALINNVGIAGPRANLEDVSIEDWNASLQTNLTGAFLCIKHVLPEMKARRSGAIVNVSTASVRTLPPARSPYITSKAALEGLTRSVAREAGPFNVRCNAVRPGLMDNARLARVLSRVAEQSGKSPADIETEALSFVSMRSKVQMSEVAAAVDFLCSDAARHVTGQIIAVDGGVEWEA
jgi:NAD(P)-dependent dehydrogenase (short-subunit alcohol dehydrogenase family)